MKFTIDIDDPMVETYGYDGEPDGEVEFSIRDHLLSEMNKSLNARFETKNISEIIQSKIDSKIDGMVKDGIINEISNLSERFMDEYLDREIVVTDRWGEEKYKGTLREKIHKAFDAYLQKTVDKNGRASDSSYDSLCKREDFLVRKILDEEMSGFTERTITKVREAIKGKLTDELQTSIGKGIVDNIGIPKLIDNIKMN